MSGIHAVTCKNSIIISIATFFLVFYTYAYIGLKAVAGVFAVGSILKYSGSILNFSTAVSGMMDAASQLWANHPYLVKYFAFIDLPSAADHALGKKRIDKKTLGDCEIEFSDVSFQYPHTSACILKDINLTVKAGQKLAVVGRNGSGKTTLIKLLCRLYEPTHGKILLNGTDIREYNYEDYMAALGVVFQDFKLFSFSLGQNVSAAVDYDREKTEAVLRKIGFGKRLDTLPEGTETMLYKDFSEDGVEISGGEAQKIALARAVYHDCPMIVLDEPTAALDPIAEAEIYADFNEIVGDKTAIS